VHPTEPSAAQISRREAIEGSAAACTALALGGHAPAMDEKTLSRMHDLLPQIEGMLTKPYKIAIKAKGRILFIDLSDVVTVEAQGNYVLLRRTSGSDRFHESISTIAEKLLPYGFVRIHRSVLINASFVEEIHPSTAGKYVLRIRGGKEFTVSRTYKMNLHSITPLWFGTGSLQTY
jgi:two-component system LytT family response regulator